MNQSVNLENSQKVVPYKNSGKEKQEQVAEMFDSIAPKYDFLNHLLSFHIDKIWRRKVLRLCKKKEREQILDIATGTGDFILEIQRQMPGAVKITGVDISEGMLAVARKKMEPKGLSDQVDLRQADSQDLPFPDNHFDLITVAFGVRNFADLPQGLSEMLRVLKPGGELIILEFSRPQRFPIKQVFHFYFTHILPLIGKKVSKNASAYAYLPESVSHFPFGEEMKHILKKTGFEDVRFRAFSFGIAMGYHALK